MCGQVFPAAQELLRQYQAYADCLASHAAVCQALQDARAAMTEALEQWGRKAGKEALARALSQEV